MAKGAQQTPLTPRNFHFVDIDQFRSFIRTVDVDFTPLARKIDAEQVILNLPGFDINFIKSFPRIINAKLGANATNVGFLIDDGIPMRLNGVESELPSITIGSSGAELTSVERAGRQYASIVFT